MVELAIKIEIDVLKKPIGKQDHYPACYGGINFYKFNKNDSVNISKNIISKKNLSIILSNSLLFWTGITRSADTILKKQNSNHKKNTKILNEIRDITMNVKKLFEYKKLDIEGLGKQMDRSWKLKKNLANGITNNKLEAAYSIALKNGAIGGKILGAGGGGFILFIAKKKIPYSDRKES